MNRITTALTAVFFFAFSSLAAGQPSDGSQGKLPAGTGSGPIPLDNVECLFDPAFHAKTAVLLSEQEARQKKVPLSLVRLANGKLAVMARDKSGSLQPFYMRGIETGFWDTRNDSADYDKIFETYRKLNANAAMFMIHWSDIEPADGKFDFSFTDTIVAKAQQHGVKIVWVLFMHEHSHDMKCLPPPEELWMYNVDTRDGANYAIQWVKDKNGAIIKDIPTQRQQFTEILPCYSNPIVYNRIVGMLQQLAAHYKNSPAVIGTQIGNEEGISYQGTDADFNPYTIATFERWKKLSGDTSWTAFKLAIVKLWWSRFTTAYHLEDAYKLTMFNPIGGGPEKGDPGIIARSGTNVTTFRDSKIDVIATMFYGTDATRIWKNLDAIYQVDHTYSYPTRLPVLMSTEIGIGRLNTLPYTQEFMIDFLERGSQGFAVFCYGHMASLEGVINANGTYFQQFMAMVKANEDIIWPGLPGPGDNISIAADVNGAKISCLHKGNDATLGMLHFPAAVDSKTSESREQVPIAITVRKPGTYLIELYKDGVLTASRKDTLTASKGGSITIDVSNKAAAFIRVRLLGSR